MSSHLLRKKLLLLFVCCVAGMSSSTFATDKKQLLHPVAAKPQAPNFSLLDLDGKRHSLKSYNGKVVILNFWATWCPPCREELPSMERAYQLLKKHDIVMLAIDVGEDNDTIFTFTVDYPVTFPLLIDADSKVTQSYPVVGLPTTYIIDPQGRIAYRAIGSRVWDNKAILNTLRSLTK